MTFRQLCGPLFLLAVPLAFGAAPATLELQPPPGVIANGKHVVLLAGDEEYRSEEALPMLAKILSQRHGFKATVLFPLDADGTINPNNPRSLPGAAALDTADVIVMSLRFRAWPDEAMQHFDAAVRRGVPLIALRTSTHAFNFPAGSRWSAYTWNSKSPWPGGFGKHLLGETWVSHWGKHKFEATRGVIEPGAVNNPLLRGVIDLFTTTDVYEAAPPADATILVRGIVLNGMNPGDGPADHVKQTAAKIDQPVNSPAMPVAWTRLYRTESGATEKIFTTTMGAASDFTNESLRRLIVNATYWAAGLDIPAHADVAPLDGYAPHAFGFNGYRTGLTPADHALGKTLPAGGSVQPSPPKPAAPVPAKIPAALNAPISLPLGAHVAIIGNALGDRMQHFGTLETLIHAKYPKQELVFRNLAVSGDELAERARSKNFGTPDQWLTDVGADVIFAFFGFNEAFAGPGGLAKFKSDLDAFLQDTRAKHYGPRGAPQIVLFSPLAVEPQSNPDLLVPTNAPYLRLYAQAMAEVAGDRAGVTFIDLYTPSEKLFTDAAKLGRPLTINGFHLNAAGDAALAPVIFKTLFGESAPTGDFAALQAAVVAKNEEWHNRYRTVDGYNIYGERSKIAYESVPGQPKVTNRQVMDEEMAQRDVLTANRDRTLWAVAAGEPMPPGLPLPPVMKIGSNKPGPNPDGTYNFLSAEDAIAKMTLAPGVRVNVFASENEFPELAKAVQMNWDTKGRLWVAVWPNYPERTPTSTLGDSILILEDTDGDGRADKCTHFLDHLNCPTGFQFFRDGVLVMQAPDLWFVRDTDGDDRADTRERVLMGMDSADSHHTANSIIYEPGGALLLSDGVFLRTQVETPTGPVRNIDGAIYRYEPRTGKFETYASYNFMNPHGRAFDYWGNDLITDATGNHTYFGTAFSGHLDYPEKHPRMKEIWNRPSRPSAGSSIITSTNFPPEYWGDFLNPNVIGFQGVYRLKLVDDGSGLKGERQTDLVSSTDPNFRPIDTNVGPDGAIYLIDWHNPLIGHLQSHLRDPNRDHIHGRIYRFTYEGRPLAVPPPIDGAPVPALLDLLKRPENQIRNLAKIELGKRPTEVVVASLKTWIASLDPAAPDYAHHLTEALWVCQWQNVVNRELLVRLLNSPDADARAAATRVLVYWRDRVPDALALLRARASDENARVRLHAVRGASFFPEVAATEVALAATKLPVDYYLDYVIGETLRQLRPQWRQSLGEGATLAGGDPASIRYLLRTLTVTELLKMPRTPDVMENILFRQGVPEAVRSEALDGLAAARKTSKVALLLAALDTPTELDVPAVGRLLVAQPAAELRAQRPALRKLAFTETAEGRFAAWAALALVDGSLDTLWAEARQSPLSEESFLGGIALIPDQTLRASAYDIVMSVLQADITALPGPDSVVASMQRHAIRAAVSTRREPAAVFAAIASLIKRGHQVTYAAQGLRALPRNTWPTDALATAARDLTAWVARTDPLERSGKEYIETVQAAAELVSALPPAEATPLQATLASLRLATFVVRTVPEEMRFDTPRLVVEAGKPFEIIFENPDGMPHNFVIVKPGTRERVGHAAMTLLPEQLDAKGRAYLPASTDILAATKMLETGQSESLKVAAIRKEGVYEFICTFPGHWAIMHGQLIVTKDIEGHLRDNPAAPSPVTAAIELCDPAIASIRLDSTSASSLN